MRALFKFFLASAALITGSKRPHLPGAPCGGAAGACASQARAGCCESLSPVDACEHVRACVSKCACVRGALKNTRAAGRRGSIKHAKLARQRPPRSNKSAPKPTCLMEQRWHWGKKRWRRRGALPGASTLRTWGGEWQKRGVCSVCCQIVISVSACAKAGTREGCWMAGQQMTAGCKHDSE